MSTNRDLPAFLRALLTLAPPGPTEGVHPGHNEPEWRTDYDELKRAKPEIARLAPFLIGVPAHSEQWCGATLRVNYVFYEKMKQRHKKVQP